MSPAACPFGLFFGRLANFVNQELWGAPTNVPWAVRFPEVDRRSVTVLGPPRHPSQLYEAVPRRASCCSPSSWWMFWRTQARYEPGKLVGAFIFFYGLFRFGIEFVREPDAQLIGFAQATGLHMGQWLSLPMILGGALADADGEEAGACGSSRSAGAASASRDRPLERALRERIQAEGPITVEAYMEACNAYYYATRDPLGRARRFHHRARNQPDVRRDGRRRAGRLLAAGGGAGRRDLCRAWPGPGDAGRRCAAGACARRVSRATCISSKPARCCARHRRERCRTRIGTRAIEDLPARPLLLVANEFLDALAGAPACRRRRTRR